MPTLLNDTKGLDPPVIVISGHKRISKKSFSPKNITGSQVCQGKKEGLCSHTTKAKKTGKTPDQVINYFVIGEYKFSPHRL